MSSSSMGRMTAVGARRQRRLVVFPTASMLLVCFGLRCVVARPTVRELRTYQEYEKLIAHHAKETGLPVVVDFYSDSCGPCRMIAPVFKRLAAEFKDRAVFAKVNVATNRDAASRLRISSMPTFHFYSDGKRRHSFSGAGEHELRSHTERLAGDFARKNVRLAPDALATFYAESGQTKTRADLDKILAKCASMGPAPDACVGGAALELVKKLEAKFGAKPDLEPRYVAGGEKRSTDNDASSRRSSSSSSSRSSSSSSSSSSKRRTVEAMGTEELVQELARRGSRGDEAAAAAADAARRALLEEDDEEEEEDEEDDVLPEYRPPLEEEEESEPERVVIMGGGPAGLSAAIYAARAGLAPVVVAPPGGGQLQGKGVWVENFPGVNATGPGLVEKMQRHAAEVGAAFYWHAVTRAHLDARPFVLETSSGANLTTHSLIVATGANARWLGVDGEADFRGGGVSSCATCDGFLYRGRDVAVVGGGDAAMEDALVLARTSKSVTVVHRRDKFRASHAMADRVLQHPGISVRWNATVERFRGRVEERVGSEGELERVPFLEALDLRDVGTGDVDSLNVAATFVAIGHDPNTALFQPGLQTDRHGYLLHRRAALAEARDDDDDDSDASTNHTAFLESCAEPPRFATELSVPGVFAAGDVADATYRQAITSAGTGAMAALDAERYLSDIGVGVVPGVPRAGAGDDFDADILEDILGGADLHVYRESASGAPEAQTLGATSEILNHANARTDL